MPALSLYPYGEAIRSALYQFKGCFDVELAPVFLDFPLDYLRLRYHGYVIVPAPSSKEHDEKRGFNHVVEMFRPLGLPMHCILQKTSDRKQADLTYQERQKVGDILTLEGGSSLKGKKILFVDDVYTTGATCKACLNLLKQLRPAKLAVLTMAKTLKGK